MSEKIDLIKPHIRHFCKEGYLDDGKKKTLYDLSDQYQVSIKEVDALVKEELRQVREKHIDYIYKESGQPDAALHDTPDLFTESKRQFPDMINIGQLRLSLNENVEAPAFLPVKGLAGISLIHNNLSENEVNNLLQNITVRLLLSLPRGLAKITLIDPLNLGGSFINLSGLDQQFLHILDDDKAILPFLQNFTKEIAAFNFNELGNKYADIHAYNKVNRSKARPFQIILCSSFPECFDANALSELERIFRLAAKTGLFFIVASKENGLTANQAVYKTLVANTTVIKQTNDGYEVLSSVDLTLFNKGYKLVPNFNSVFNSDTILKINNEFDSQKYPLTKKVGASKSAISEIELLFASDEKGKEMEILLKQSNDNILLVSEQKGHIEKLLKSLIINVSSSYNENDIQLLTSNSLALSENTYFPALECNILSNKLHYVYGLLKHIEQIIVQREESFKKQSVDNYQKYREKSGLSVPRLLYVLDNLHEILDSDTTISDEIILLLNDLLIMSGKYGIHFIVAGAPTDNLLKLNLSEDFNFKAFVSIQPENIELVSNLISEENMDYAAQPEQGIIFKESSSTVNQFTVNKLTDDELSKKLRNIESPDTNRILSRPTSFVDYNDDYPLLYQQIKLKHINPVEDKYVIGIPRFYKDNYYSLPYANGESASKILVLGDDNAALKSLMQSINFAKKGNVEIMAYDAAGNINSTSDIKVIHSDLEEYLQSFVDKIDGNNDVVKGIVCLFNMDEFDMQNQDAKLKLKDFIHQTAKMGIYLLFHAKSDNIFASDNLGEITKTCFEHKIALMDLMDSPNSLIAPIHYVKNAGFITTPQKPLEIVYEGINSVSGFGIDNIWLLKND